jgi:hypothetical protein
MKQIFLYADLALGAMAWSFNRRVKDPALRIVFIFFGVIALCLALLHVVDFIIYELL